MRAVFGPWLIAMTIFATALPSTGNAVEVTRQVVQNAPGICGAVDPAEDLYLRRYPPSLYNAKPGPVQVICQLSGDANSNGVTYGGAYFKNSSAVAGTVACTMAAGSTHFGVSYKYKSQLFAPGENSFIGWAASTDFPAGKANISFSCTLPQGFAIHELWFYYNENVGL